MNNIFWDRVNRLEELARKATQGEWKADRFLVISPKRHNLARTYTHSDGNLGRLEPMDMHDNAAFIAAANPAMIFEMITELRQMEMDSRGLKHDKQILEEATEKGAKDNLELRGRLNQLEKEANWLAEQKACKEIKNGCCCGHERQYWREEARKAVINE